MTQNFDPRAVAHLDQRINVALSANLETVRLLEALQARIAKDTAEIEKRLQSLEAFLPAMREQHSGKIAGDGSLEQVLSGEGGNG